VVIVGEVAAPFTPGLLLIRINADGLSDVSVMPAPVGGVTMINFRNKMMLRNAFSVETPAPRGAYTVTIDTVRPTSVQFDASF
jgi:hypothetical protein